MNTAHDTIAEQLRFGLGDRLAKSLHVAGITSNDMADELEVSRTTISNYLNDRTHPKRLYLRMWALKTGVPIEWLETGQLPESPDSKKADALGTIRKPRPSNPLVAHSPLKYLSDYRKAS